MAARIAPHRSASGGIERLAVNQPLDERVLAGLIREHSSRLLALLRAFTDDDGEAEDLLQDTWIIVADRSHRRRDEMPLKGWIYSVAINRARSHRRTTRRRRWLASLWGKSKEPVQVPPSVGTALAHAALWGAVAGLPRLQREVVILRIVDGLSTADAAVRLGRAEGTVKASLHRGLRTLRERITHDSEEGR